MENDFLLDDQLKGSALETNKDIAAANKARSAINETTKAIRYGRNAVWFAIGFLVLGTIWEVGQNPELVAYSFIGLGVMAALYGIGLFAFTKNPVTGLAICLGVYLLFNIINTLLDPSTIIVGILRRLVFIYFMGNGLYHARQFPEKLRALRAFELSEADERAVTRYQE